MKKFEVIALCRYDEFYPAESEEDAISQLYKDIGKFGFQIEEIEVFEIE